MALPAPLYRDPEEVMVAQERRQARKSGCQACLYRAPLAFGRYGCAKGITPASRGCGRWRWIEEAADE